MTDYFTEEVIRVCIELQTRLPHLIIESGDPFVVIRPIVEDCLVCRFRGEALPTAQELGMTVEDAALVYAAVRA